MSEKRSELMQKRYSITERQLQGLVKLELRHSRACLAVAVRKQSLAVVEK